MFNAPRGHNSYDAFVPVLFKQDRRMQIQWHLCEHFQSLVGDALIKGPSLHVSFVELVCKSRGICSVIYQQSHRFPGVRKPAGGVDAWADGENHVGDGEFVFLPADFNQ